MTSNSNKQELNFFLIDVFAEKPLRGNPLAVVPDADGLSEATMAAIAREFNQSETTFLLSPTDPRADWRLRSFTPAGVEVFGAGHNSLGAWWWLAAAGRLTLDSPSVTFYQEIGHHILPVDVISEAGHPCKITIAQTPPSFGDIEENLAALAAALRLAESDFALDQLPAQVVSTGAPHLMVSVKDRTALGRAKPDNELLASLLKKVGGQGCYLFCLDPINPAATAQTRFFNPTVGIWEDPATGSAAGPLACYLFVHCIYKEGPIIIEQGVEMGRPSLIEVEVLEQEVRVSGGGVVVAEGTLRL